MNDPAVSAQAITSEAIAEDIAAFEDFFREQSSTLFARLCLITGNRAEAEELAQDAFLKVWERWDRVGEMEEPIGYLYSTAMNLFRKRYRRAVLALRRTVTVELRRDEFAVVEDRSAVAQAMQELAPRQRAALVLTELIGFSSEEASRMLGVSPGTVSLARVTRPGGDEAALGGRRCLTHVRSWNARVGALLSRTERSSG
jgi:RNA polymerase sigma factor (sigma-70 family)